MLNVNWPGIKRVLGIPLEEPEDGHFNIAAVGRNDIQEMLVSKMGIDPTKAEEIAGALTTEAMTTIALRLGNDYFNLYFWSSLQSVFSTLLSVEEVSEKEIIQEGKPNDSKS
jgi:hypothetical protein